MYEYEMTGWFWPLSKFLQTSWPHNVSPLESTMWHSSVDLWNKWVEVSARPKPKNLTNPSFQRPKNIQQALKRRLKLTWRDVANHWFIFESFRQLREEPALTRTPSTVSEIEDISDSYRKENKCDVVRWTSANIKILRVKFPSIPWMVEMIAQR